MPRPSNDVLALAVAAVVVIGAALWDACARPVSLWEDRDDV